MSTSIPPVQPSTILNNQVPNAENMRIMTIYNRPAAIIPKASKPLPLSNITNPNIKVKGKMNREYTTVVTLVADQMPILRTVFLCKLYVF